MKIIEKIIKDPERAYYYARKVIKGRWPEAEPYIMKNSHWAYLYTRDIIKGRWPEAEPYMIGTGWTQYIKFLKRHISESEAEDALALRKK